MLCCRVQSLLLRSPCWWNLNHQNIMFQVICVDMCHNVPGSRCCQFVRLVAPAARSRWSVCVSVLSKALSTEIIELFCLPGFSIGTCSSLHKESIAYIPMLALGKTTMSDNEIEDVSFLPGEWFVLFVLLICWWMDGHCKRTMSIKGIIKNG